LSPRQDTVGRSRRIVLHVLLVLVILGIFTGMLLPSVKRASWDGRNDVRTDQLRTLYLALLEHRKDKGEWPQDLESVRQRFRELLPTMGRLANERPEEVQHLYRDYVGWPRENGPHRVEYSRPPTADNVMLRAYGHHVRPNGCSDKRVDVTMDVTTDGVVTLGGGRVAEFATVARQ
jgi:type II secretory pathway pseudopilin PulG